MNNGEEEGEGSCDHVTPACAPDAGGTPSFACSSSPTTLYVWMPPRSPGAVSRTRARTISRRTPRLPSAPPPLQSPHEIRTGSHECPTLDTLLPPSPAAAALQNRLRRSLKKSLFVSHTQHSAEAISRRARSYSHGSPAWVCDGRCV